MLRAPKNELIGIQNFVIEVDAKYIKGMLENLDINPSASINRWIIAILTFYFDLVHVPAAFHGPNGLSRCRLQPNDEPEPEDKDFDDWIDRLHGFIHFINPIKPKPLQQPSILIYIHKTQITTPQDAKTENFDVPTSYSIIPRPSKATKAEEHISQVIQWHKDLIKPIDISFVDYNSFIHYCTKFFHEIQHCLVHQNLSLMSNPKNPKGTHSTHRRYTSSSFWLSLHGQHAHAKVQPLQVHHAGTLQPHPLH